MANNEVWMTIVNTAAIASEHDDQNIALQACDMPAQYILCFLFNKKINEDLAALISMKF